MSIIQHYKSKTGFGHLCPDIISICRVYAISRTQAATNTEIDTAAASQPELSGQHGSGQGSYNKGLSFYADFESGTNASFSSGDRRITNPSPDFKFADGKAGRGLVVSPQQKIPVPEYTTDKNINSDRGTLAFWYKPDREVLQPPPAGKSARWLLASRAKSWRFYLFCKHDSIAFDYYARAPMEGWLPDTWHHIAVQWNDRGLAIFMDGKPAVRKDSTAKLEKIMEAWKYIHAWRHSEAASLYGCIR